MFVAPDSLYIGMLATTFKNSDDGTAGRFPINVARNQRDPAAHVNNVQRLGIKNFIGCILSPDTSSDRTCH